MPLVPKCYVFFCSFSEKRGGEALWDKKISSYTLSIRVGVAAAALAS